MSVSLLDLLTALEQSLVAEIAALRARDVDAIERAVAGKRRALAALGGIRTAFRDGVPGRAEAIELLGRCRALNDIAGGAIAVQRQVVVDALAQLGVESEGQGYGASRRTVRAGRALAVC
jgi:hypothetical protein